MAEVETYYAVVRKSLAAQFICFLLMALVLSQAIGF